MFTSTDAAKDGDNRSASPSPPPAIKIFGSALETIDAARDDLRTEFISKKQAIRELSEKKEELSRAVRIEGVSLEAQKREEDKLNAEARQLKSDLQILKDEKNDLQEGIRGERQTFENLLERKEHLEASVKDLERRETDLLASSQQHRTLIQAKSASAGGAQGLRPVVISPDEVRQRWERLMQQAPQRPAIEHTPAFDETVRNAKNYEHLAARVYDLERRAIPSPEPSQLSMVPTLVPSTRPNVSGFLTPASSQQESQARVSMMNTIQPLSAPSSTQPAFPGPPQQKRFALSGSGENTNQTENKDTKTSVPQATKASNTPARKKTKLEKPSQLQRDAYGQLLTPLPFDQLPSLAPGHILCRPDGTSASEIAIFSFFDAYDAKRIVNSVKRWEARLCAINSAENLIALNREHADFRACASDSICVRRYSEKAPGGPEEREDNTRACDECVKGGYFCFIRPNQRESRIVLLPLQSARTLRMTNKKQLSWWIKS